MKSRYVALTAALFALESQSSFAVQGVEGPIVLADAIVAVTVATTTTTEPVASTPTTTTTTTTTEPAPVPTTTTTTTPTEPAPVPTTTEPAPPLPPPPLPPPPPPPLPIIGVATPGNTIATVAFSVPASYEGPAITAYTVTCGGLSASGSSSPITVTGLANGTQYSCSVTATTSAGTSPASGTVNVTPAAPSLSLTPTSLSFPSQPQGSTSAAQTVTLTGSSSLSITGITASGDFARTPTCGATLAAGASCTVAIIFTPTAIGIRSGTLSITSSAAGSPHTVTLTGSGGSEASIPLSLALGWNLLGNSLNQPLSVATLFSDPNLVFTVWKWESSGSRWLFFTPMLDATAMQAYATGKGYGVLSQIAPGEGYWVNAKVATELVAQTGTAFVVTAAHLSRGWNLMASGQDMTPSAFNRSLSEPPPSPDVVPQNLTSIWAWDNPANGWYFYAPSLEAQGGTALTDYITSKGYRDFTQHNRKLGNGTGFWVRRP